MPSDERTTASVPCTRCDGTGSVQGPRSLVLCVECGATGRVQQTTGYRTVVADPPWWPSLHRNTVGRTAGAYRAGPQRYYPLLAVEQIERMVPRVGKQAHLYLWVLNQHVDWGYRVARAWGFEPQQMLTWCKPGYGTGQFQCNTEQVLLCRRGSPAGNPFGRTGGTQFNWPRGRHSEKPAAFFDLVERVSPGPYLEMFCRTPRLGWTSWGNEVPASDATVFKDAA